jgi:hypothetical protein
MSREAPGMYLAVCTLQHHKQYARHMGITDMAEPSHAASFTWAAHCATVLWLSPLRPAARAAAEKAWWLQ